MCKTGRGSTKRTRAAVKFLPAVAPLLGFGVCGDGTTPAVVGGIE
jgi:hypothetical protein